MKIENKILRVFLQYAGADACSDGRVWALANCATLREVWDKCPRADWMLWMLRMLKVYDQSVSRFLVKMLREQPIKEGKTLYDLMTDERSRTCVDVLEKFLDGKATIAELKNARSAAYAYATAAAASASAAAAYAAAAAATAAAMEKKIHLFCVGMTKGMQVIK